VGDISGKGSFGNCNIGCWVEVQDHKLRWAQSNRFISASIAVAEFDFEGLSIRKNFDNGANLSMPEIALRQVNSKRHDIKQFNFFCHNRPFKIYSGKQVVSRGISASRSMIQPLRTIACLPRQSSRKSKVKR
jgi:hypothetical protein